MNRLRFEAMSAKFCTAKTAKGAACTKPAGAEGLCAAHLKTASIKKSIKKKREPYERLSKAAVQACESMGWSAHIANQDSNYEFLTLEVDRQYGRDEVDASIEFVLTGDEITYRLHQTSYYGHGLKSLMDGLALKLEHAGWNKKREQEEREETKRRAVHNVLVTILRNFDKAARQIARSRRETAKFQLNDEYDAQDLLHALLRAYFDDVRVEEYVPSYAGASSRMDFLIKQEEFVVEVKFASSSLRQKSIGEQLIIDISRYAAHPNCKALYCLVFDPNNHIANPAGLENDLTKKHAELDVHVVVTPK